MMIIVCTATIISNSDILEFVQSSKNIIDVDTDEENKTNKAAPVSTSSVGLSTDITLTAGAQDPGVQKGPDKMDLTRKSGYKFRSSSSEGPVDILRPGLEMSLNRHYLHHSKLKTP
ncbi:hypothetical protein TNCV_1658711 [Trichonephila clavipes]|nr:hypothetical protein TNCV_1658711 [Trichonephila clavipes]